MDDSPMTIPRRDFLRGALAVSLLAGTQIRGAQSAERPISLIDTNAWLDQWPVRRLALETPAALAAKLAQNDVTRAWVSSFDGMLHKDMGGVNARLAETCRRFPIFEPLGMVNLS